MDKPTHLEVEHVSITVGSIEQFEDRSGIGIFSLVHETPRAWTISRMRILLEATLSVEIKRHGIESYLAPRELTNTFVVLQDALSGALYPDPEAAEILDRAREGETKEGDEGSRNFPPGS